MELMNIKETKDYTLFQKIEGNRNLNRKHIDKIKQSITDNNYYRSCPIIVNDNMEIVDGQHRFQACKELGIPIYFIQETLPDEALILLNVNQRKWSADDYVRFYALNKSKPDYQRLLEFMESYHKSAMQALILCKPNTYIGGSLSRIIREGSLTFTNVERHQGAVNLDMIATLQSTLGINKVTDRMLKAILTVSRHPKFVWSIMIEKATKYRTRYYSCISGEEWEQMFVDLYNFNSKSKRTKIEL